MDRRRWNDRWGSALGVKGADVMVSSQVKQGPVGGDQGGATMACGGNEDTGGGGRMHLERQLRAGDSNLARAAKARRGRTQRLL